MGFELEFEATTPAIRASLYAASNSRFVASRTASRASVGDMSGMRTIRRSRRVMYLCVLADASTTLSEVMVPVARWPSLSFSRKRRPALEERWRGPKSSREGEWACTFATRASRRWRRRAGVRPPEAMKRMLSMTGLEAKGGRPPTKGRPAMAWMRSGVDVEAFEGVRVRQCDRRDEGRLVRSLEIGVSVFERWRFRCCPALIAEKVSLVMRIELTLCLSSENGIEPEARCFARRVE